MFSHGVLLNFVGSANVRPVSEGCGVEEGIPLRIKEMQPIKSPGLVEIPHTLSVGRDKMSLKFPPDLGMDN